METQVMTIETLKAHVTFSLDLVSPIYVREDLNFRKWYPSLQKTFLSIDDESINAFKRVFKHITEEGYISTWHDHVDDVPTSGFMLIIQDGYDKTFGVDTPEECCRWQYNELFTL
jgi:hypothetical protein